MDFNQMGHLVKLNIKNDIISQNDQFFLLKWDILCLLHAYFLPFIYNFTTYQPTHPPTYVRTYLPQCITYLPCCSPNLGLAIKARVCKGVSQEEA
jgi:hypothetical protein